MRRRSQTRSKAAQEARQAREAKKIAILIQDLLDIRGHLIAARELQSAVRSGEVRYAGDLPTGNARASVMRRAQYDEGVTVTIAANGLVYYGHVSRPRVRKVPQTAPSVVLAALRACVRHARSAVQVYTLKRFIAARTQFSMPPGSKPVSETLSSLTYSGRVVVIKRGATRNYYTLSGETHHVRPAEISTRDALLCAFRKYWKSVGKRPFSAKAFGTHFKRVYPRAKQMHYGFVRMTLETLQRTGQTIAIRKDGKRKALWAWGADWRVLSRREKLARTAAGARPDSTRALRLAAGAVGTRTATRQMQVDIQRTATWEDLKTLVLAAKIERANANRRDSRTTMEAQPVTCADIERVTEMAKYRGLRKWKGGMSMVLQECVQRFVARGEVPPLVYVGRVRHEWYYDVRRTKMAVSYVHWLRSIDNARAFIADREIEELAYAVQSRDTEACPAPALLLRARANALTKTAQAIAGELTKSHENAPLTRAEEGMSEQLGKRVREIAATVQGWMTAYGSTNACDAAAMSACGMIHLPAACQITTQEAALQISTALGLSSTVSNKRVADMSRKVRNMYRYEQRRAGDASDRRGDNGIVFDRIDFAMHCARMWAGGHTNLSIGLAHSVMGACRDAHLLGYVLAEKSAARHHESILHALGVLDDAEARKRVVEWFLVALGRERGVHALDSQMGAASLALAPKLIGGATEVLPIEQREVLAGVAERCARSYAGRVARNVLRAWAEPAHRRTLFFG